MTAALGAMAFIAFANAIVCALRAITGDGGHDLWLRSGAALSVTAALCAWTLVRLRAARNVNQAPAPPAGPGPPSGARAAVGASGSAGPGPGPEPGPTTGPGPGSLWTRWRRALPLASLVLAGAGAWSVAGEWSGVQAALVQLTHLRWMPVRWAIYAEALAYLSLTLVTVILLRATGRRLTPGSVLGITLAGNALSSSIPGGAAWGATFSFDQLRRRGLSRRAAAAVLLQGVALSALALIALLIAGTVVAGGQGPAAPAWPYILALPIAAAAVLAVATRHPRVQRWLARLTDFRLERRLLAAGFGAALLSWLADCGCLAAAIAAVSGRVPWQGLLAVYALTQISQAVPFTPGGVGVVEGTASLLLIAYGMPPATALAAVLVYRIISFWALLPIGWGAAGVLLLSGRRRMPYVPARMAARAAG